MKRKTLDIQVQEQPPVQILTNEQAEQAEFLICDPVIGELQFPDNLTDFCYDCGHKVQFRWHAPRNPKRICWACVLQREGPK
jgi:hypothetical protein